MKIYPPEGFNYPDKALKVVLLPAPLVPINPKISPGFNPNEIFLIANFFPYFLYKSINQIFQFSLSRKRSNLSF